MFGTQHLAVFVVSGILLNLTPGQDTLYIVGRSLSQGRKAGLLSVIGIVSGAIIHTLFAAFGISAILATSARAFVAVKLLGAAYLIYLGVKMLLERQSRMSCRSCFSVACSSSMARFGVWSWSGSHLRSAAVFVSTPFPASC